MTPKYSVVIPTRNGAATLPALLDALRAQRTIGTLEIIAVDSGSTDGTIELLQPQVHSLIRISPREFDHGLTRNLAVARARGEFVVLLVQDALPVGNMFLESLAAPLARDAKVAGTFRAAAAPARGQRHHAPLSRQLDREPAGAAHVGARLMAGRRWTP